MHDPYTRMLDGEMAELKPPARRGSMPGVASGGAAGRARNMAVTRDDEMKWDERPIDLVDWEAEEKMGWCLRMWRAKWNLKPRGPKWIPEIVRMTWFLQVIGIVMGIHGGIDGDLGGPFFCTYTQRN